MWNQQRSLHWCTLALLALGASSTGSFCFTSRVASSKCLCCHAASHPPTIHLLLSTYRLPSRCSLLSTSRNLPSYHPSAPSNPLSSASWVPMACSQGPRKRIRSLQLQQLVPVTLALVCFVACSRVVDMNTRRLSAISIVDYRDTPSIVRLHERPLELRVDTRARRSSSSSSASNNTVPALQRTPPTRSLALDLREAPQMKRICAPTGQALEELYNSTNGPKWKNNANWLQGDPCQQAWYGVLCKGSNITHLYVRPHISSPFGPNRLLVVARCVAARCRRLAARRSLNSNQLVGTVPLSIGNLTTVNYLYASRQT